MTENNNYWLISYPRSGNTFVRYILEYLSKRPTKDEPKISQNMPHMGVNQDAPMIAWKSHIYNADHFDVNLSDGMILIIRDYREVIARHYKQDHRMINENIFYNHFIRETGGYKNLFDANGADYISCLQAYDMRTAPKLLIYYEDLINNPVNSIRKIGNFTKQDQKSIDDFCNNINFHKTKSVNNYPISHTRGQNTKFHQKRLSKNILDKMTNSLKTRYPDLFEKYLSRYNS